MAPPDDPMPSDIYQIMTPQERMAHNWLYQNADRLRLLPVDSLYSTLWREVPGANTLTDSRSSMMFTKWSLDLGIPLMPLILPMPVSTPAPISFDDAMASLRPPIDLNLPPSYKYNPQYNPPYPSPAIVPVPKPPPSPTSGNSDFLDFFKKLVPTDTKATLVKNAAGEVTVSIGGVNAELKKAYNRSLTANVDTSGASVKVKDGSASASSSVDWDGTLKMAFAYSNASISGEVGPDQWKIGFSFKVGPDMPDLGQFGTLVKGAVDSFGQILNTAQQFRSLSDGPALIKAVSPQVKPLSDAAKAISQVYGVKPGQLSFSFNAGLTGTMPGATPSATRPPPGRPTPFIGGILTWTF